MEILTAVLFSIGISLIISAFVIVFVRKQIQDEFYIEDKIDEQILKSLKYLEEKIDNLEMKE